MIRDYVKQYEAWVDLDPDDIELEQGTRKPSDKVLDQLFDDINNNNLQGVKDYIALDYDPNAKNKDGKTPLMIAYKINNKYNRQKIIDFLEKSGAILDKDYNSITTMNDIIEFLDENYELDTSLDDLDGLDSWAIRINVHDTWIYVNAHIDDEGDIWFGFDQLKYCVIDPDWDYDAEFVINQNIIDSDSSEDDIEAEAFEIVDQYIGDIESYDPSYSFDGKLPLTEKEMFSVIDNGAAKIDETRDKMVNTLIETIKNKLKKLH